MLKILYIVFIFLPFFGFTQDYEIPYIPFKNKAKQEKKYLESVALKDTTSLIVHLGYSRPPLIMLESDYIIYSNNGKVQHYEVFWQANNKSIRKKKRKRVKKDEYSKYWQFLYKCVDEGKFKIDQAQLEVIGEKANNLKQVISGGKTYHLGVYKGTNNLEYISFLPNMFSSEEYPGFKEKQKLVEVMEGFKNLFQSQ